MSFFADRQTLEDLNIGGKYRPDSVFGLFSSVVTAGGQRLLEELFRSPMTETGTINRQSELFAWFGRQGLRFPFTAQELVAVEEFLDPADGGLMLTALSLGRQRLLSVLVRDEEYGLAYRRICVVMGVIRKCRDWLPQLM